ncbi:MAG: aminotransferase class V-fold PLP-dependent enzyme, partial [Clostridia bacterium]|nr:aminotransferase class V-fold PLP-dependent enzyme [Clostridia bacterium]
GAIPADDVGRAIRKDTALVSLMTVNNETGGVTDLSAVAEIIKRSGSAALLHTDAVQAFRKIPFSASSFGPDLITVSAHKIHGMKGCGALYVRRGLKLPPLLFGGGQESGLRPGTEALPQIASFAAACREDPESGKILDLKNRLLSLLKERIPEALTVPGSAPQIVSLSLPGYRSEVIMNFLEAREIYVSKSSACKQGKRSHVLEAMGLPGPRIDGTIRVGLSRMNTEEDIDCLIEGLEDARRLSHRS